MAKSYRIVKMVSEEDTGYFYTTTKPTKGTGAADILFITLKVINEE